MRSVLKHDESAEHRPVTLLGDLNLDHPSAVQLPQIDTKKFLQDADFNEFNELLAKQSPGYQLVAQTDALLADGLSYEQRIAEQKKIATRIGSLHDYYSALIWLRFPHCKRAVNAIQMQGILAHGAKMRSRHQQSITHLDEAGAWIAYSDEHLHALGDAHDWTGLFLQHQRSWKARAGHSLGLQIEARIFGHAIFEMMHDPSRLLAAKVVWVRVPASYFMLSESQRDHALDQSVADALLSRRVGLDPKWLSTVPISGIPGWCQSTQDQAFYQDAPCFRPKPFGREYSLPIELAP